MKKNTKERLFEVMQRLDNTFVPKIDEQQPEQRYRIVSDYGYGDRSWVERNLTPQEVVDYFKKYVRGFSHVETLDDVPYRVSDYIYYYEEDNPNDEPDWDPQEA
jgi:hypothetical protein